MVSGISGSLSGDVSTEQLEKYDALLRRLRADGAAAVAFSGGVDSAFLLHTAREALSGRVLALTAAAPFFPKREQGEAEEFCRMEGIRQIVFESEGLDIEGFRRNPKNRCYLCKRSIFSKMTGISREEGFDILMEGSNLDDEGDYRPGMRAISELGIKSPLKEGGFTKQDIRCLSRHLGLPTWDKQSFACLASRFEYGDSITEEKLAMVDRSEQLLLDMGFKQVRVRVHGGTARIEVLAEQFSEMLKEEKRLVISRAFKEYGFSYVSVDLDGYRTGSMNETLQV